MEILSFCIVTLLLWTLYNMLIAQFLEFNYEKRRAKKQMKLALIPAILGCILIIIYLYLYYSN